MSAFVKRIWWIVIPTALAVAAFQLYWLLSTYASQQKTFVQVATDALQRAYETSTVGAAGRMRPLSDTTMPIIPVTIRREISMSGQRVTHKDSGRPVTGSISVAPEMLQYLSPDLANKITAFKDSAAYSRHDTSMVVNLNMDNMNEELTKLVSGIFTLTDLITADTAVLGKNYRKELAARQIDLPFRLTVYRKDTMFSAESGNVFFRSQTMNRPVIVAAQFPGIGWLLFGKMLWPIVMSFLLVVLITGCIWVLWRTVLRQKKLDEMKNDFISNITHELKTPVAILRATNEALLNFGGMHDTEKTSRYLRLEQDELRKLQGLVDNIMLLTRMEHGKGPQAPEAVVSVSGLLQSVAARFADLPDVRINVVSAVAKDDIFTRPADVATILSNLVDNAIKYTLSFPKEVTVTAAEVNGAYHFGVKDTGIGIDKAHLPFLFDKFYRVPHGDLHDVKGYGLGLSHVKSLVDKLGGTITVTSQPGEGTEFIVQLKIHEPENQPAPGGR